MIFARNEVINQMKVHVVVGKDIYERHTIKDVYKDECTALEACEKLEASRCRNRDSDPFYPVEFFVETRKLIE